MKLTIYRYLALAFLVLGLLLVAFQFVVNGSIVFAVFSFLAAKAFNDESRGVITDSSNGHPKNRTHPYVASFDDSMYSADPGAGGSRLNVYDH